MSWQKASRIRVAQSNPSNPAFGDMWILGPAWSDSFAGSSLDPNTWGYQQSSSGLFTVSNNQCAFVSSGTNTGILWSVRNVLRNYTATMSMTITFNDNANSYMIAEFAQVKPTSSASYSTSNTVIAFGFDVSVGTLYMRYYDSGGASHFWSNASQTWGSSDALVVAPVVGHQYKFQISFNATAGTFTMAIVDITNSTTYTATAVANSATLNNGSDLTLLFRNVSSSGYPNRNYDISNVVYQ